MMQPMKKTNCSEMMMLRPLPVELTYAATVDIHNIESEITEFMIRRACDEMDKYQQFPFCSTQKRNAL